MNSNMIITTPNKDYELVPYRNPEWFLTDSLPRYELFYNEDLE